MKQALSELSALLQIPEKDIMNIYKAYWGFIREHVSSLPLKEELTEEEFDKLQTSVNIPGIGKLYCTYQRWLNMKNRHNYNKNND